MLEGQLSKQGDKPKFGNDEQQRALESAQKAARDGDALSMVKYLFESFALDGLKNFLGRKWPTLPEDDRDWIAAESVEDLRFAISAGKEVRNISSYLFGVADKRAYDILYNRRPPTTHVLDGDMDVFPSIGQAGQAHGKTKQEAFKVARQVVGDLGGDTIQRVMNYYIDEIERGGSEYLTSDEVGADLGLTAAAVRKAKQRGFDRLRIRFLDRGLSPDVFQEYIQRSSEIEGEVTEEED